jgi:3-hydroxyisobutyrate dehydrogenase-like beta-hydroxyacid dehydrogenase
MFRFYRMYAGLIGSGQFEPVGFDLRLCLKDAWLALAPDEEVNVPLPFSSAIRENYLDALARDGEGKVWPSWRKLRFAAPDWNRPRHLPFAAASFSFT